LKYASTPVNVNLRVAMAIVLHVFKINRGKESTLKCVFEINSLR